MSMRRAVSATFQSFSPETLEDVGPLGSILELGEGLGREQLATHPGLGPAPGGEHVHVLGAHDVSGGEDHEPLHGVAELPNVPRPRKVEHALDRRVVESAGVRRRPGRPCAPRSG